MFNSQAMSVANVFVKDLENRFNLKYDKMDETGLGQLDRIIKRIR